jgi:DNA-binding NarL/FixJ family response regulator
MGGVRIWVVDDHPAFREGIRSILHRQSDLHVVGETTDARATYRAVEQAAFDLMLVDVTLPGVNGLAMTRELRRLGRREPILMLSMHSELDVIAEAVSAGANGYLFKLQADVEIVEAIRTVMRGERYLPPDVPGSTLDEMLAARRHRSGASPHAHLSPRQRDVFDLLLRGYSNKEIANTLFISPKTVESHRTQIFRVLGVHSIVDLVRLGARHHLVPSTGDDKV